MRGGYLMSSRVAHLKWLGALQLIHGMLMFILTIVYFAIDFDEDHEGSAKYAVHVLFTYTTILLAIGAGTAGASMSRYQGLIHNISGKNVAIPLSVMNGFSAIMTMVYKGSHIFYSLSENDILDDNNTKSWEKAVIALIIINFVLCFFDMIVAFMFVTLAVLWQPNEQSMMDRQPSLPPTRRAADYREPEPEFREYRSSDRYHTGGYGNGYYGGGDPYYGAANYRTLPALKY